MNTAYRYRVIPHERPAAAGPPTKAMIPIIDYEVIENLKKEVENQKFCRFMDQGMRVLIEEYSREINGWPYAFIMLTEEMQLGEQIEAMREAKEIVFGSCSIPPGYNQEIHGHPPTSFIMIKDQETLNSFSKKSIIFAEVDRKIKAAGKLKETEGGWLCTLGVVEDVPMLKRFANKGDMEAEYLLGLYYYNFGGEARDQAEAFKWMSRSAAKGYMAAEILLGVFHIDGEGEDPIRDPAEGVRILKRCVERESSLAQNNLAECYTKGIGVEQNHEEAFRLYKLSADQGLINAQTTVGECYEKGKGVTKSDQEALKWYRIAGHQGDPDAIRHLAEFYLAGRGGLEADTNRAMYYYKLAADRGDEKSALLMMGEKMGKGYRN